MNKPMVSIIVNCFNGAMTLNRALDSIFSQTFTNWEIVFWDNVSTDNSAEIARSYGSKLRYFSATENTNLSVARQEALQRCRGEYVAFLDCDDIWYPNKLELQLKKIEGTDFIVCYAGVNEVFSNGEVIRSLVPTYEDGNQFANHLEQFDINMVTPLIRMAALTDHGITINPKINSSVEYNLFMQLAMVGGFCTVKVVLGEWTIYNDSLTNQSIEFWSKDRRCTLECLKSARPELVNMYAKQFNLAYATGDYYEARFLISNNNWAGARRVLKNNAAYSKTFFLLWVLSMIPGLWRLLHNEGLKRVLSVYVLRKSKSA